MSLDYESFLVAQLEVNMHILGLKSQSPFPTDHSHNVPKAMMEHCQHKANSPYVQHASTAVLPFLPNSSTHPKQRVLMNLPLWSGKIRIKK